jgi:glycosyltransferase involved in cell wall biosynthesis
MKLSVPIITYNHERFIANALESVLMQHVDFSYEIVVGEDCSTDATREILLSYQKRFPDKIRLLLPEKNLGMMGNFIATLKACRGEYIALLEGDDYWTSSNKLQKQVAFLDAHPECSACFHNVLITHESTPEKDCFFHEAPLSHSYFHLKDIVSSHFIPTCSTVYRGGLFEKFPDWYKDMPMGDWPLHILNAEHGSYAYLDEVMATYRVHGGGIWSSSDRLGILNKTIQACHQIDRYLDGRHPRKINNSVRSLTHVFEIETSEILKAQAEFGGAFIHLVRAFLVSPKLNRRTTRCFRKLLTAWCGHYCAIGKKVS